MPMGSTTMKRASLNPWRLVYGVASLPLGVPVELEVIFQVTP